MSGFSVWLILQINRLVPNFTRDYVRAKRDLRSYSEFEYSRAPSTTQTFAPWLKVRGKRMLDIGCGLGGFERYYLESSARQVVAIDLSRPRMIGAQDFVRSTLEQPPALFSEVDARRMAFSDNTFDLIVSSNTIEHIFGVEAALQEIARVSKPDGLICLSFPPYHSPWGAHLGNWIKFPWCQVFFSERSLVEAANRLEAKQHLNAWMPAAIQLDLRGLQEIPHLNRISLREFNQMLLRVSLRLVRVEYKPIGWRNHQRLGRLMAWLTKSARLREYVTNQAVYILKKA